MFCYKTTVAVITIIVITPIVDNGADAAVDDIGCSITASNKSASVISVGVDVALHLEALDGSILDVAERGAIVRAPRSGIVKSQRLAVAEEGALERVAFTRANHRLDADVLVQFHILSAEGITNADGIGEVVPLFSVADDVRVFGSSGACE